MTTASDPALVARYGGPALARLWAGARDVLERRALAPGGAVVLRSPDDAERRALEEILGRGIPASTSPRVALDDLDRALRDARLRASLADVLEAVGGRPLEARVNEAAVRRTARRDRFERARAHPVAADEPGRAWVDWLERGGLARCARGREDEVLDRSLAVLARLPADPPMLRTVLAGSLAASPHLLDDGQPVSSLVLRALALREGVPPPRTSHERRSLWAAAGVLADTVSTDVLALGLAPTGDDPASRLLAAGAALGEPVRLTLRALRSTEALGGIGPLVFACENPSILELAADRLGAACPPLVCLDGEPSVAGRRLLTLAQAGGAEVRYHGDFDAKGIEIASSLYRSGARPWRFGMADYLRAIGSGLGTDEVAGSVSAWWDEGLRDAVAGVGRAVYEEQVAEDLLSDLAAPAPGARPIGDVSVIVSPSSTRAYLLDDPLLDWLSVHGRARGYLPDTEREGYDPRTDLLPRILEAGQRFEAGIVAILDGRVGVERIAADGSAVRDATAAAATTAAMRRGAQVIAQAVLVDPRLGTAGIADLLVRSDVLAALVPGSLPDEEVHIGAPALPGDWHYRVVEVKFRTIALTVDGGASPGGGQLPYLGQAWLYNRALGEMQGWTPPAAFLLGRGTKMRDEVMADALARLGRVDDDRYLPSPGASLEDVVRDALAWRRRLAAEGAAWEVLPHPSVPELRPHLRNLHDAPWHLAKRDIGEAQGELSVLPRMNPRRRAIAEAQGIVTWRDPALEAARVGLRGNDARVFEAVRAANTRPAPVVEPARIETGDAAWRTPTALELFVDFETVSDLDDDLEELPARGGGAMVFQVGCGHVDAGGAWAFRQWTADRLRPDEERRVLDAFHAHVAGLAAQQSIGLADVRACHWSPAEPAWAGDLARDPVRGARARHPNAEWPELPWFDLLLGVARAAPLAVTGAFGFGLKAIARGMAAQGLIATAWQDGPADGLGAMVGAWWCDAEAERLGVTLGEIGLMGEIARYNETDCRVMAEVITWLRHHR